MTEEHKYKFEVISHVARSFPEGWQEVFSEELNLVTKENVEETTPESGELRKRIKGFLEEDNPYYIVSRPTGIPCLLEIVEIYSLPEFPEYYEDKEEYDVNSLTLDTPTCFLVGIDTVTWEQKVFRLDQIIVSAFDKTGECLSKTLKMGKMIRSREFEIWQLSSLIQKLAEITNSKPEAISGGAVSSSERNENE